MVELHQEFLGERFPCSVHAAIVEDLNDTLRCRSARVKRRGTDFRLISTDADQVRHFTMKIGSVFLLALQIHPPECCRTYIQQRSASSLALGVR